jgi:hypothetical protein
MKPYGGVEVYLGVVLIAALHGLIALLPESVPGRSLDVHLAG